MRTINRTAEQEESILTMPREFKGIWIPRNVWLSNLSWAEKGLVAEIESLSGKSEGCYATNRYLASFLGCTENRIAILISGLKKRGVVHLQSFNGRKRFLAVNLAAVQEQTLPFDKGSIDKGRVCQSTKAEFASRQRGGEPNPLQNSGIEPPLRDKMRDKKRDNPHFEKIQSFVRQFFASRMKQYPTRVRNVTQSQISQSIDTVDKLVRIDNYPLPDVIQTIVWAVDDDFWSPNVLSLVGLRGRSKNGRTKFENIQSGMGRDKNTPTRPPDEDLNIGDTMRNLRRTDLPTDNSDYGNMMGIKDKDFVR